MMYGDVSQRGRPFAKDPAVVRFRDRYWLYYSIPPVDTTGPPVDTTGPPVDTTGPPVGDGDSKDDGQHHRSGLAIGIAQSADLQTWQKVGEVLPAAPYEANGLCAPGAIVLGNVLHLFYQTYGNGRRDAICHATSTDGLQFTRNRTNPIFAPTGAWTCGRAIDADVIVHNDQLFLYFATRDPTMTTQMLGVASAPLPDHRSAGAGFERGAWTQRCDAPILKPELPWEQACIEAPALCKRGETLFMFYGGAYNNSPQQIGCAMSTDGITWRRLSDAPFLPNGEPDSWNASESGHPYLFVDDDGRTYLFYQGNNDQGHTWFISCREVVWPDGYPHLN